MGEFATMRIPKARTAVAPDGSDRPGKGDAVMVEGKWQSTVG